MTGEERKEKARQIATADLRRSPDDLLVDIVAEAQDKKRSGDEIIIDMIAKFSSLLVVLGRELDRAQKVIARLTWVIVILTVVLLLLTAAHVYVAFFGASTPPHVPLVAPASPAAVPSVEPKK